MKHYIKWEDLNMTWDEINMTWDEIYLIEEVLNVLRKHGGGMSEYIDGNPWDKTKKEIGDEKTKKFIKLFCKVNNMEYEKVNESNNKITVTIDQVEKILKKTMKVGIKLD